jgi:hypothetical protein
MAEMFNPQNPEILELNRQRKMADLLTSQGMQTPQGQTVAGGIYVPPNPMEYIAKLFSTYAGTKANQALDTKEVALAKALREQEANNLQKGFEQLYGTPAQVGGIVGPNGQMTQQTTADMFGPNMELNAPYKQVAEKAAIQPDRRLALATLLAPEGGATSKAIATRLAELEFAPPKQAVQTVVSPGGALVGADGKVIYQAPFRPLVGDGGMGGADGEGRYNKKGDYIAPGGVFIGKSEVAKDREIVRTAEELRQGLKSISAKDIKDTDTIFGDVSQGGVKGYIAKQLGSSAVSAQAKVNASSVMQTLQNLPPGPASDKDIAQAKSSFPGYGNAKDLEDWITNTNAMLDRKINITNQKYGSENWYGANPVGGKPGGKKKYDASNLPAGVTREMWNVMTPEERESF